MLEAAIAEVGALHTVMIGDTSFDMVMAGAAGVDALGVAWGYHPPAELVAAGARAVAQRFDEVPALLEEAEA
jgi:phosphoglycolate phosphatase